MKSMAQGQIYILHKVKNVDETPMSPRFIGCPAADKPGWYGNPSLCSEPRTGSEPGLTF